MTNEDKVYEAISKLSEPELDGFLIEICRRSIFDELDDDEAAVVIERLRKRIIDAHK